LKLGKNIGTADAEALTVKREGHAKRELTRPVVYAIVKPQDEQSWDSPRNF